MIVLLTGATGFIGRNVLKLLILQGSIVYAFGRQAPAMGKDSGIKQWIEGDLESGSGLADIPWSRIDTVIHLAAAGVKAAERFWPQALAVNVTGTQRLLNVIDQMGRAPAIFIACTFYEKTIPKNPVLLENPYIATKAAASELARLFAISYSGSMVFGTFFQVYGPDDNDENVLSYAATKFRDGHVARFGSGRGLRDWIYIDDAAYTVVSSISHAKKGGFDIDIGSGKLISIREMVEQLYDLYPSAPPPVFDPSRDQEDTNLAEKARNLLRRGCNLVAPKYGLTQFHKTPSK